MREGDLITAVMPCVLVSPDSVARFFPAAAAQFIDLFTGTGTPEAGGITSREVLEILRGLRGLDVVACDVVEVAPAYDHAEITGLAAAHCGYEILSLCAAEQNGLTGPSGPSGEALGV